MTIDVEEWHVSAAVKLQPQSQKKKQRVEQVRSPLVKQPACWFCLLDSRYCYSLVNPALLLLPVFSVRALMIC